MLKFDFAVYYLFCIAVSYTSFIIYSTHYYGIVKRKKIGHFFCVKNLIQCKTKLPLSNVVLVLPCKVFFSSLLLELATIFQEQIKFDNRCLILRSTYSSVQAIELNVN